MSEAARSFQIIPKVSPFAGKQFDAAVTSKDIVPGVLLGSLKNALKAAGWIEVETGVDKDTFLRKPMNVDVVASLVEIHVDASKAPELLNAAEALASALNAEGAR